MKYRQLQAEGQKILESEKIFEAKHEALLLLFFVFDIDFQTWILKKEEEILLSDIDKVELYFSFIQKRVAHIPLQYITHVQNFYGFDFFVDENVLIPRQDTECLIERILLDTRDESGLEVLDMCTGSGCIAITLKKLANFMRVSALDISDKALDIAKKNAYTHAADIRFLKSDMFSALEKQERYDIIVSNPPYISVVDMKILSPEVLQEPVLALEAGIDGLDFYRILAKHARQYLYYDGRIYLEIGYDQAKDVEALFREQGYTDIAIFKDLAQLNRVLRIQR